VLNQKQKGYATVLTLILFSALGLSLFSVFNSGQIVTHKLKLQNAVDAATYSSANVVAREMNYMAYTNRAMVANQLAIGQLVALHSWSRQIHEVSKKLKEIASYVSWFPYGGTQFYNAMNWLEQGIGTANDLLDIAYMSEPIAVEHGAIEALSQSQAAVHIATAAIFNQVLEKVRDDNNKSNAADDVIVSALFTPVAIKKILQSVKRIKESDLSSNGSSASDALTDYNSFKGIVEKSEKTDGSGFGFVGTKKATGRSYNWLDFSIVEINKRGGNEFALNKENGKYLWEWSAMDTVVFYLNWPGPDWLTGHVDIDLGGGAAHATNDSSYDTYYKDTSSSWWFWGCKVRQAEWGTAAGGRNCGAAGDAADDYSDNKIGSAGMLNSFYKLNPSEEGAVVGPEFVVSFAKNQSGVRTSNKVANLSGGSFDIEKEGNLSKGDNYMFAVAKAQVYFSRSPDSIDGKLSGFDREFDKKQEFGNLFNPYWQVRLIEYDATDILFAQGVLSSVL